MSDYIIMEKSDLLWRLLEIIIFCIPVGALIWKAAKQAGSIEEMQREIQTLKERISENEKNSQRDIAEIKQSINQININQAEILVSLSFIKEAIATNKKEGK